MMTPFSLSMGFGESEELEVCSLNGEDGPDDVTATFSSLIEDWIEDQALDGELHPALDDTLNMLHMLNWAQRTIVARMSKDDPYRIDLFAEFDAMHRVLQSIKDTLT